MNSPALKLDLSKSLGMFIIGEAQSTSGFLPFCSTRETGGAGHMLTLSVLVPAVMSRGVSRTQIFLPFTGEGADILRKGLCSPVISTACLKLGVSTIQLG